MDTLNNMCNMSKTYNIDKLVKDYLDNPKGILDLTSLNFSMGYKGNSSHGMLFKANTEKYYFKLSQFFEYVGGSYSYESVCEVIGSRLCNLLGFENAGYRIVHAKIKISNREYTEWLCVSENYKRTDEHRTTLENFIRFRGGDTLDLLYNFNICKSEPFFNKLVQMMFVDYLMDNRDRHGANIELLISDNKTRLSPIYDLGCSLISTCQYDEDKINKFDIRHDGPVNNFLVSMFWKDIMNEIRPYLKKPYINIDNLYLDDLKPCFKENGDLIINKIKLMIKERYIYA